MAQKLVGLEFLRKNEIKNKKCKVDSPYVFISYSHDDYDSQIVMNVFKKLYDKGFNLWIDIANMPVNEKHWDKSATYALRDKNCRFAFFFRSEDSMIKETIASELEFINSMEHIGSIIVVDIWHDNSYNALNYRNYIYNHGNDPAFNACNTICKFVSPECKAIRLASDADNDINKLVRELEEELNARGIKPSATSECNISSKSEDKHNESISLHTDQNENPPYETISLIEFLKKYNHKNFRKSDFNKIRLIGKGNCAKYSTEQYDSTYDLVWDFVKKLLEEKGENYIKFVNEKNKDVKNPPFITSDEHKIRIDRDDSVTYRKLDINGLECYSMCRHYSQYGWIDSVLKKRMQELEMPLEMFSIEYLTNNDDFLNNDVRNDDADNMNLENKKETENNNNNVKGITEPISIKGKKKGDSAEAIEGRYLLEDFLKKYNNSTFQAKSCKRIDLIGIDGYEKYSVKGNETARNMVFAFAMSRINDSGQEYIDTINSAETGKNPIFITAEEYEERKANKASVTYKAVTSKTVSGYCMCTHYSEYDWLKNSLMKQIKALRLPIDKFYLELE